LLNEYDKTKAMTIKAFCKLPQISEGSFSAHGSASVLGSAQIDNRPDLSPSRGERVRRQRAACLLRLMESNFTRLYLLTILKHLCYDAIALLTDHHQYFYTALQLT
jgi:hypothetical protein